MFNRKKFSQRLNLLKVAHNLSNSKLASLLSLKSKGSISAFESGKGIPSLDVFMDIADLFGVSIEWLAGRSDTPYDEKILLKQEELLIDLISLDDPALKYFYISAFFIKQNKRYMNPSTRNEFSLPVRANIIFALNCLRISSLTFYVLDHPLTSSLKDFNDFKNVLLPHILNTENKLDTRWKLCSLCYDTLQDFLRCEKDIVTPVFDINNAPSSSQ
ncbi:MAG: helix-turn-helix domain-containing protein [Selenomonadaceae bacterium]